MSSLVDTLMDARRDPRSSEYKAGRGAGVPTKPLLTLRKAADFLRVSPRTIEREARDGRMAIVRIRSIRLAVGIEAVKRLAISEPSEHPLPFSRRGATLPRSPCS